MKVVATNDAKTHLSRYLKEVAAGEEIVIASGRRPVAKLVPYSGGRVRPRVGETMDAPMRVPEEALRALSARELAEWGL